MIIDDLNGNLRRVVRIFRALGHTEFRLDYIKELFNIRDSLTGIVKVDYLLRPHSSGTFGSRLFDKEVVGVSADRAILKSDRLHIRENVVAVSRALFKA